MIIEESRLRKVILIQGYDDGEMNGQKNLLNETLIDNIETRGYLVLKHNNEISEQKTGRLLQLADVAVFMADAEFACSDMMNNLTLSCGETLHALDHSMRRIPVVMIYKDNVPDIIIKGEEAGRIIHLR